MEETTPTGYDRRELFVDARDLQSDADPENPLTPEEYLSVLQNRGREKLGEHQRVEAFEAVVRTVNPTYAYGEDFQLGDTITVTDERLGVSVDAAVSGASRSAGRDGEGLDLTLGYALPTLRDILNRKAAK